MSMVIPPKILRSDIARAMRSEMQSAVDKKGTIDREDVVALFDRVYDKKDDFARGFTEALIEYGLGRPYAFTDEALAEEILTSAKAKDYNMNEFVLTLVKTKQFWTK